MECYNSKFGTLETCNYGTEDKVQVFQPTMEEFLDFERYIGYLEERGAHKAGIAKVIPPPEWVPRSAGYSELGNLTISSPVEQIFVGSSGAYQLCNVIKPEMSLEQYCVMANSKQYEPPSSVVSFDDLERNYWRNLHCSHPIYGADVPGTLTDKSQTIWNIAALPTILKSVLEEHNISIQGVNTPYLYFGMWKSTFPWHTEDADLYSINYLHFGAPKFWYVVPPSAGLRLETVAQGYFPSFYKQCHAFMRHKTTVLSPTLLRNYSVPYNKVLQFPGEFIITFPYSYHAGFNTGFNCAESTNFAMPRWIDYGKYCSKCDCIPDAVKIDMDCFVRRFQPERYESWRSGNEKAIRPQGNATPSKLLPRLDNLADLSPKKPRIDDSANCTNLVSNQKLQPNRTIALKLVPIPPCSCGRCFSFSPGQTLTGTELSKWRSEDGEVLGPVGAALSPLFIWHPFSFNAERAFNHFMSKRAPHCAVCQLIASQSNDEPRPPRSKPLLFERAFAVKTKNRSRDVTKSQTESTLLQCRNCLLVVHAFCYGADECSTSWRCERCASGQLTAHCSLCIMRGGALKPTKSGRWAHVLCALLVKGASFETASHRGPILEPDSNSFEQCDICLRFGALASCTMRKVCHMKGHSTCCAYFGLVLSGCPLSPICFSHTKFREKVQQIQSFEIGDPVLVISPRRTCSKIKVSHGLRLIPGVITGRSETTRLQLRLEDLSLAGQESIQVDPPINAVAPNSYITVRWHCNERSGICKAFCYGSMRQQIFDLKLDIDSKMNGSQGHIVPFYLKKFDPFPLF